MLASSAAAVHKREQLCLNIGSLSWPVEASENAKALASVVILREDLQHGLSRVSRKLAGEQVEVRLELFDVRVRHVPDAVGLVEAFCAAEALLGKICGSRRLLVRQTQLPACRTAQQRAS